MVIDSSFRENFYNYDNDINLVIEWNELLKKWISFNELEEYPQLFGVLKREQIILYFGQAYLFLILNNLNHNHQYYDYQLIVHLNMVDKTHILILLR